MKKMITKKCEFCNEFFSLTEVAERKRIKQFGVGAKFCSSKCMGKCKSAKFKYQSIDRKCLNCGKDFKADKPCQKTQCCSQQCAGSYLKKQNDQKIVEIESRILEYWQDHTLHEVANKFETGLTILRRHGIYSTPKLLSCPKKLTIEQQETINGNLLGDGSIGWVDPNSAQNSCFVIGQKSDNQEYVEGLSEIYEPFSSSIQEALTRNPSRVNGKICHKIEHWDGAYLTSTRLNTVNHPIFSYLRKKWYLNPDQKRSPKVIPKDLKLTWRTAAIWMCDDGANHGNDVIAGRNYQPRYLMLHTESFSVPDVEFLISILQRDLEITATMNWHNGKPTIRIGGDEWHRFIENIKPFIPWECFQYKCVNREKVNTNTSGFVGVYKKRDKWVAYKCFRKKQIYIGSFKTIEEAVFARELWIKNNK